MPLAPTPENLRSEMARFSITRIALSDKVNMHRSTVSQYLTGSKPLQGWSAHNLGWGINMLTGAKSIDVDMDKDLLDAPRPGRPPGWNNPEQVDPMRRPKRKGPNRRWNQRKRGAYL